MGELVALDFDSTEFCGDFTNPAGLAQTVQAVRPDLIVNAAAHTAVDKAESEPELVRTINALAPAIANQLTVDARYASYVDRQAADVAQLKKEEALRIPSDFDYAAVVGLSAEVRQKLERGRPTSLAHAAKLEGITPAAQMLLLAHLKKSAARKTA